MIAKETPMNSALKFLDLSDEEKVRLKEICEELKSIFNADKIDIVVRKPPIVPKCDYEIKIHNGDAIGYIFNEEQSMKYYSVVNKSGKFDNDKFFEKWVKMVETKDKMIENHSVEEINEEKIPATSEWIIHGNSILDTYYECSKCGYISTKYLKKCPDCNAKMTD